MIHFFLCACISQSPSIKTTSFKLLRRIDDRGGFCAACFVVWQPWLELCMSSIPISVREIRVGTATGGCYRRLLSWRSSPYFPVCLMLPLSSRLEQVQQPCLYGLPTSRCSLINVDVNVSQFSSAVVQPCCLFLPPLARRKVCQWGKCYKLLVSAGPAAVYGSGAPD